MKHTPTAPRAAALFSITLIAGTTMSVAQAEGPVPDSPRRYEQDERYPAIRLFNRDTIPRHAQTVPNCVAFAPDGRSLAVATADGRLNTYFAASAALKVSAQVVEDTQEMPYSLAYSPDGKTIALGLGSGTILLLDAATARTTATLRGHRHYVSTLAYAPDGKTLASSCGQEGVRLWDTATRRERAAPTADLGAPAQGGFRCLAFSPDGKLLALAGSSPTIRLWDAATWEPLPGYAPDRPVKVGFGMLAFASDGATLAVDEGGARPAIALWGTATGRERMAIPGKEADPSSAVKGLGFLDGGRILAVLGDDRDRNLRLWDAASGAPVAVLKMVKSPTCMAVAPDGKTIAVGSEGANGLMGVVDLFDFDGKELRQRRGEALAPKPTK